MFKKEDGFTLIEMLIVLMIITVLIILIIPNLTDKSAQVHDKGCDALISTVQAQVHSYQLDHGKLPVSLNSLVTENYISNNQQTCKNGNHLQYDPVKGIVSTNASK